MHINAAKKAYAIVKIIVFIIPPVENILRKFLRRIQTFSYLHLGWTTEYIIIEIIGTITISSPQKSSNNTGQAHTKVYLVFY